MRRWPRVRKMKLKRNMRDDRADMVDFVKWQMQIGNGLDEVGIPSDSVELPLNKISPTQDDLIATIFPDPDNPGDDCAILVARNIDCEAINETILSRVSVTELLSADKLLDALEEEGLTQNYTTLYVAASRAIASSHIKFFIAENPDGRSVRNVVYRQALIFSS
jgi:hypothetical protein